MKSFEIHLEISPERFLDYYRGTVKEVITNCPDGTTVQFPASLLKQFVTAEGIRGDFILTCDEQFKHAELQRLRVEH